MALALKPVDSEYMHPAVRGALENLSRLQGELQTAVVAHEAAKATLTTAKENDRETLARQQVAGESTILITQEKPAQEALDEQVRLLDTTKRAIEIATDQVIEAVEENIGEMRGQLNQLIADEHDKASNALETAIPAIERVQSVVACRNWIENPTKQRRSQSNNAPPIPAPPGYDPSDQLINILRVALQPVGIVEDGSPQAILDETRSLYEEARKLVKDGLLDWPVGISAAERVTAVRSLADVSKLRDELRVILDRTRRERATDLEHRRSMHQETDDAEAEDGEQDAAA